MPLLRSALLVLCVTSVALADVKEAPRPTKASEHGVGRFVPDLAFTGMDGKETKLSAFKDKAALVVAFTSTSCPLSKKYAPTLAKLETTYGAKNVGFLFVNPIATDSADDVKQAIATHKLQGVYVRDTEGTFAKNIGAGVTTDVFVLDAARTVVYRGAIDDQYGLGYSLDAPKNNYLVNALDAVLTGKTPFVTATTAPGCALDLEKAKTTETKITYHAQVERLVQAHCVECHRKDGVAPFALDTAKDVLAHAGMIKKVVEKGTMPPWFATPPEKGKPNPWGNDRSLPAKDKETLLGWLDAKDHPMGDKADAPKARVFDSAWQIGKPDAVFKPEKAVKVQATGTMPYQNVTAETNLTEDKWVQALEVRPSAKQVVHHVLVFVQPPKDAPKAGLVDSVATDERHGYYAIYVPGNSTLIYPDGFGKRLPKGSKIRFQIHYTPNGTATEDTPELGVIYAKQKPEHEVYVAGIVNTWFKIPPGADNHEVVGLLPVPFDVKIISFLPHMHLRGKSYRYEVTSVGKKNEVLLDIPHYDFNWQLQYKFAEPLSVPRGSLLRGVAHFDNSEKNPANPDPKKEIRWGAQTFDEMMLGYVEFYIVGGKK